MTALQPGMLLEPLVSDAGCDTALLINRAGRVLAYRGFILPQHVPPLAGLLAGTRAVAAHLFAVLDQPQGPVLTLEDGDHRILIRMCGPDLMLVAAVRPGHAIALVKVLLVQISDRIAAGPALVEECRDGAP